MFRSLASRIAAARIDTGVTAFISVDDLNKFMTDRKFPINWTWVWEEAVLFAGGLFVFVGVTLMAVAMVASSSIPEIAAYLIDLIM